MADREVDFLLVGGGMASAHCAAELRRRGAEGSILLAGREPEPPYERPPLSKEYMRGEAGREDAYVNPAGWYEENGVELLTGVNVMSLDPAARTAKLQGGEEVAFGKALLATGAMVNILRVEGAENEGIHYLRAFGNSDAIRADAEAAEHVVLIGGSYIGTEVAASLTAKGVQLHDRDDGGRGPLADLRRGRRALVPREAGAHGVTVHGGEELEAFEGDGRVKAVLTKSGRAIECDAVVVGAGVRADAMLAQRAGLEVDNGIVCDSKLRDLGRGDLRGRRLLLLRQRRPRPAAADRALGRGDAAGDARGAQHARRGSRLRRRPLLLQRPRRLGEPRVRRPGLRVGRGDLARRPRLRRVLALVPEGRQGRRRSQRRALRRPGRGAAAARRRVSTSPAPGSSSPIPTAIWARSPNA